MEVRDRRTHSREQGEGRKQETEPQPGEPAALTWPL